MPTQVPTFSPEPLRHPRTNYNFQRTRSGANNRLDRTIDDDEMMVDRTFANTSFAANHWRRPGHVARVAGAEAPVSEIDDLEVKFYDLLRAHSDGESPLDLIKRFEVTCADAVTRLQGKGAHQLPKGTADQRAVEAIKLERNTWALLYLLLTDREKGAEELGDIWQWRDKFARSDYDMQGYLYRSDRTYREMHLVTAWLEGAFQRDYFAESVDKSLDEAQRRITLYSDRLYYEESKRKATGQGMAFEQAQELDPDARLRGAKLDPSDVEAERQMFMEVFKLLRCGSVESAQEMCVKCGHAWAAAALEGAVYFHNYDFAEGAGVNERRVVGNMDRRLWRQCCYQLARDSMELEHSRAVFGVLGGDLGESGATPEWQRVCSNFEDFMWGYFKIYTDNILNEFIGREESAMDDNRMPHRENYSQKGSKGLWSAPAVFIKLGELDARDAKIRHGLRNPFYYIQSKVITDAVPESIERMWDFVKGSAHAADERARALAPLSATNASLYLPPTPYLRGSTRETFSSTPFGNGPNTSVFGTAGATNNSSIAWGTPGRTDNNVSLVGSSAVRVNDSSFMMTADMENCLPRELLRFLAHLVLCLREHGEAVSDQACNGIVETYVDYLMQQGRNPRLGKYNAMAPLYIAQLPEDRQVAKCAELLEGFMADMQTDERRSIVEQSRSCGINVRAVLETVAAKVNDAVRLQIQTTGASAESVLDSTWIERLNAAATMLVDDENPRLECLEHINAVLRLFLMYGKVTAAENLRAMLLEKQIKEKVVSLDEELLLSSPFVDEFDSLDYVIDALDAANELHMKRSASVRTRDFEHVADTARLNIEKMLSIGWGNVGEWPSHELLSETALSEWDKLRRRYVPFMCNSLYEAYVALDEPEQAAAQLAHFTADEKLKYYELFSDDEMATIMKKCPQMS